MAKKTNVGITVSAQDKASATLSGIGKSLNLLAKIDVARVFLEMASAAGRALNVMADFAGQADKVAKAAKRVGISASSMSQLGFAAEQSGNSVAEMQTALTALTRRAAAMPEKFQKWGISVRDSNGVMKDSDALLDEVADRMQSLGSAAERSAMGQDLMSEAGRKLVPMLVEGSAGLNAFREEADRLGITISDTEAALSEEFNDSLNRAKLSLAGVGREIFTLVLPYAIQLLGLVKEVAIEIRNWVSANKELIKSGIEDSLAFIAESAVPAIIVGVDLLNKSLAGIGILAKSLKGLFLALQETIIGMLEAISTKMADLFELVGANGKADFARAMAQSFKRQGSEIAKEISKIKREILATADEIKSFEDSLGETATKLSMGVNKIKASVGLGGGRKKAGGGLGGGGGGAGGGFDGFGDGADADALGFGDGYGPEQAMQINARMQKEAAERSMKLAKQEQTARDNARKASERSAQAQEQAARQMAGPLASGLTSVITGTRSAGDALASLATTIMQNILTSVFTSALKGLATGGLGMFFNQGGLVPGAGSKDTVPAWLTPGEYVLPKGVVESIRAGQKPGQAGFFNEGGLVSAGGGAHTSVNLFMQSAAPPNTATLRRDIASGLAPVLQRMTSDRAFRNTDRATKRRT